MLARRGTDILREEPGRRLVMGRPGPHEVWIRRPRQLGDMVFAVPFFKSLRAAGWTSEPYVTLALGTRGDGKHWFPEKEKRSRLAGLLAGPDEADLGCSLVASSPGGLDLCGRTSLPEAITLRGSAVDSEVGESEGFETHGSVALRVHPERVVRLPQALLGEGAA